MAKSTAGDGPWSDPLSFTVGSLAKPILISPRNGIATTTPTYMWYAVAGATAYDLCLNDQRTAARANPRFTPAEAGCPQGTGTCSVTLDIPLAGGPGQWWVMATNGSLAGPWSDPLAFSVGPPRKTG